MSHCEVMHGDNLDLLRAMPSASVDLVFTSPPYEAARTYGIGFNLRGQAWVDWAVERFVECLRVCRGMVAWNVEGQTRDYRYSATPALFMADLHRRGVHLRKPPIFHRVGIPGSGGPDWLRNDYEFIVCGTNGGKLPWSDNTAMGHPPKWAPGGAMSHMLTDGSRVNQWGGSGGPKGMGNRNANGTVDKKFRPSHRQHATSCADGSDEIQNYAPPAIANPGNVIKLNVGGGHLGWDRAHENEAPFPEALAEFFVRSFCPPGGTVLDPHCGSGTTCAVALKLGRNAIGIDVRESQVELTKRRIAGITPPLFTGGAV